MPNCFTWRNHGNVYTTVFYTHNKFSKQLYLKLKPLWYVLHFIDWLFLDRFIPQYSFGFDTLPAYPDADPETQTVDGVVMRAGSTDTWSQIRDGAGTASADSVAESSGICIGVGLKVQDVGGGAFDGLGRIIALFETSSLGAEADILSAICSFDCALGQDNFLTEGEDELCITACSPASNTALANSDYNIANWSDTKLANEVDKDSLAGNGAYTDWTLNAAGLAQISKTGITKLGLRFSADIDNSQPSPVLQDECTTIIVRFADYGAGSAPKLVITYTAAGDVTIPVNTQSVTVNTNSVTVNYDAVLPVGAQSVSISIPAVSIATDWYQAVPVQIVSISVIDPAVYEGSLINPPAQTITIDLPIGLIITDSYVPVNPVGMTISVQPATVAIIYEAIITPDVFTVSMIQHTVKILSDLSAQLLDRSRLKVVYFLDITLQNSGPTLHISDSNIVINGQRYELYLMDLSGLGEEIERSTSKGLNPDIDLTFLNDRIQDKNHLIKLGDTYPFEGAECVIKEAYLDDNDVPSEEVTIFKGNLDEPRDVEPLSFSCGVSSALIIKDRQFKQAKITTADYPNADPDDLNKVLNEIYGAPEQVRCHAIKAGAASALAEDIDDVQMSFEISDASQFPSSGAFTYQVEAEQIRILSRSGNVLTVDTGGRGYNSTTPEDHDKGQTGFEVLTEYVYIVARHPVTSLSNIRVDKVRQLTGFTPYTGQAGDEHGSYPGKAVIAFTVKPVIEKQINLILDDTIDVSNPTHAHQFSGAQQDQNANNFPNIPGGSCMANGETVYVNFNNVASSYSGNSMSIGFIKGNSLGGCYPTEDGYITINGIKVYEKSGGVLIVNKPSPLNFEGDLSGGDRNRAEVKVVNYGQLENNGLWIDIQSGSRTVVYNDSSQEATQNTLRTGSVVLSGNSSADVVIGSSVNCDVEGYRDDGSGTYTGTPNALIERPDHVKKHFIDILYGFALADIDTPSFSAAGASYASVISGGYKFAFVINEEIVPSEFLEELAEQCRSNLKYEAGKWYLNYIPDTAPSPVVTIAKAELAGENAKFVFDKTSVLEIINNLEAVFQKNHGRLKYDESEWLGSAEDSDSASQTKHGVRPNNKPYKFWAIRLQVMADHVLAFKKLQHKDTLWNVTFSVWWKHFDRKRGDTFDISNDINNGKKFYIEDIVRIGKFKLGIRALEWPS